MKSLWLTVLPEQQHVRRSSPESLLDVQARAAAGPPAAAETLAEVLLTPREPLFSLQDSGTPLWHLFM